MLNKVLSGIIIYNYEGKEIYLRNLDLLGQLHVDNIYHKTYNEALLEEIPTFDDLLQYMLTHEMWTQKEADRLKNLPNIVENLKIEYYQAYAGFKKRDHYDHKIKQLEDEYTQLVYRYHILDEYTAEGIANFIKNIYSVGYRAFDNNMQRLWPHQEFLQDDFGLLSKLISAVYENRYSDDDMRQLSKKSEWKTLWNINKNPVDIFGVSSLAELNENQRSLISWSQLYDGIKNAQTPPDDAVVQNDNLFDGWLLTQCRESKTVTNTPSIQSNHKEVFIVAENPEDISRIYGMNDSATKATQQRRLALIQKKGIVAEEDFPDSRLEILKKAQLSGIA